MRRACLAVIALASATGCWDAADFSVGRVEGSLRTFFEEPSACTCGLYFAPDDDDVQYLCSPEDDPGFDLTFYTRLPASANQRGKTFTDVQLGNSAWASSGFGTAAAEMEYGSEEFGNPDLDDDTQVLSYREVIIWTLDVPAQRICSVLDDTQCHDLDAGRLTDLRLTCTVLGR